MREIDGNAQFCAVRPEAMIIGAQGHEAVVLSTSFVGTAARVALRMGDTTLSALLPKRADIPLVGATVKIPWLPEDLHRMGTDG